MSNVLKDSYDEHFALIIGINKYENSSNLEYAVNDAIAIKDILINKFNYKEENIKVLLDEEASHNNIMEEYYDLINKTIVNDSVLIFFAGHGTTYPSLEKDKGFLVPYDGTEAKMNTLISWDSLINASELIKAKHIFFIMDACYSGLALLRGNPSSRFLKDMVRRYSRQVLTAGKTDQRVKDSGAQTNNSIFTGYLLEALNGEAKTEQGVICASSVMNYVYNKVSCDPNSKQTPSYGTLLGEGDFIFNYDEIFSKDKDATKDNDVLVEIDNSVKENVILEENELINDIKNLLSDDKNYIKITDIVNKQLKIYLSKAYEYKKKFNVKNNEDFANAVELYKRDVDILLKIVLLLTYYGGELYSNLILKIFSRVYPKDKSIKLLYYPIYLMYYVVIISCLESKNYKVLKDVLELEFLKTFNIDSYYNEKNILIDTCNNMTELVMDFAVFFPNANYKYPLNEYVYKELQPLIDDFLYVGDYYPELFISTEILISFYYAVKNYNDSYNEVWGPLGRYTYQMIYANKDIVSFPINKVIEKLELYSKISNKEKFIEKFNSFLSKHYF